MQASAELQSLHSHVSGWSNEIKTFGEAVEAAREEDRGKTDIYVKRSALRLDDDLRLLEMPLTAHALEQFAHAGRVPTSVIALAQVAGGRYCAELAKVLNEQLAETADSSSDCLIRCRKAAHGEAVVRAVFPKKPILFDLIDLMELVSDYMPSAQNAVVPLRCGDGDVTRLTLFMPDDLVDGVDTRYGRGINVKSNEVGGRPCVQAYTFDQACLNGMVSPHETLTLKIITSEGAVDFKQTGREFARGYDILKQAGDDLLKQMGYAYHISVSAERAIAVLAETHHLTEDEGRGWFDGYLKETAGQLHRPRDRAYSVVSGLNRYAQTVKDDDRRLKLEMLTAKVLAPRPRASAEDMLEYWTSVDRRGSKLSQEDVNKYLWLPEARN